MPDVYADLSWRLAEFRKAHPEWSIQTAISTRRFDRDEMVSRVTMTATISTWDGRVIAHCHAEDNDNQMERCEAQAIDRCLALAGIGVMRERNQ
jgi:hypothetical protein